MTLETKDVLENKLQFENTFIRNELISVLFIRTH